MDFFDLLFAIHAIATFSCSICAPQLLDARSHVYSRMGAVPGKPLLGTSSSLIDMLWGGFNGGWGGGEGGLSCDGMRYFYGFI